jgi:hypothetical protein
VCIKLIPPQKKGLRNYWDIETRTNLKNIREVFPEFRLNDHEKAINIIIIELCDNKGYFCFEGVKLHIQLLLSVSFFDACLEIDTKTLCQRIWKSYITTKDPLRNKRINDLLKICYIACTKYYSEFKMTEDLFTATMKRFPWEYVKLGIKEYIVEFFKHNLPGLPKEIPLQMFKTRLSETINEIPEKIPDKINNNDFVNYMLHTLQLIMEPMRDYDS